MEDEEPINIYSTHSDPGSEEHMHSPATQELEYLIRDNPELAAFLQSHQGDKEALMRAVEQAIEEGQAAARATPKIPEEQMRVANPALYSLALSAYKREEAMQYKDPAEEKQKREESKQEMMHAISGLVFGLAGVGALLAGNEEEDEEKERSKRGISGKQRMGLGPMNLGALGVTGGGAAKTASVFDQHGINQHRVPHESRQRSRDEDKS